MIRNERQYRVTREDITSLEQAIAAFEVGSPEIDGLDPLIRQAHQEGLESELDELRKQIKEYEGLKSGKRKVLKGSSLHALPEMLIKARIAAGLTQKDLARQLGLKEQQIQRYEATDYRSASLSRLLQVIEALGVESRSEIILRGKG